MNNNLDCLLINPPDEFSRYPYLGLCYLCASLLEQGLKAEILDSAALGLPNKEIMEIISSKKPKIIGISIMSTTLRSAYQLIQLIQSNYPDGVIVVGGAHINADPEIIKVMGVTYGFRGDCEFVFPEFCKKILRNEEPKGLSGLIVNRKDTLKANKPAFIENLDLLPFPHYESLPLDKYFSLSSGLKTISTITSRGCPYRCIYCSKLQKAKIQYLSIENVVKQLELAIDRYNFQWIEFVDEIFTINRERTVEFCERIIESSLNFYWGCRTRADFIDDALLRLMKKAGCSKIYFGVESGSERIRFLDNKKISNEKYTEAVRLCHKNKIETMCYYIIGHPTETKEDIRKTIKFSLKLKSDLAYFFKMIPIPNSKLFEMASNSGQIAENIWTEYMLGKSQHPIYYPETVNKKTMDRLYRLAWIKFYLFTKRILYLLNFRFLYRSLREAHWVFISGRKYK